MTTVSQETIKHLSSEHGICESDIARILSISKEEVHTVLKKKPLAAKPELAAEEKYRQKAWGILTPQEIAAWENGSE